jgi:hypothetical protein
MDGQFVLIPTKIIEGLKDIPEKKLCSLHYAIEVNGLDEEYENEIEKKQEKTWLNITKKSISIKST